MRTHLYIPDTQIRPGVDVSHIAALGRWIIDKKPDVIIQAGDWADMKSLSSYDKGKRQAEGARLDEDIRSAKRAMEILMEPTMVHNSRAKFYKKRQYRPSMHLTLGNHENRINRHIDANPVLHGYISIGDLGYEDFGWTVHNFLEVVELDGVQYSHYFPRNANGRIVQTHSGAPSARTQIQREGRSSTSGHLQGLDFAIQQRGDRRDYGLIAGSFYLHEEDYLSPQGTAYWRGVIVKNEVKDGEYDPMFLSIDYLLRKYGDGREHTV